MTTENSGSNNNLLCGEHGETYPCMICIHLRRGGKDGKRVGFNAAQEPNDDPEWANLREAWCDRCDAWWQRPAPLHQLYNWLTPKPRMVCEHCLKNIQKDNELPGYEPGWWER